MAKKSRAISVLPVSSCLPLDGNLPVYFVPEPKKEAYVNKPQVKKFQNQKR